jgi:hypothetical protein
MLPVSAGWVGDSLNELIRLQTAWPTGVSFYCLDGWFGWFASFFKTPWSPETHVWMASVIGGLVIFLGASGIIYRARSLILNTQARMLPNTTVSARTVLIMGLSPKSNDKQSDEASDKALDAMGNLPIEKTTLDRAPLNLESAEPFMDDLRRPKNLPWQQSLRSVWNYIIAPNRKEPVKAILVVPSRESATDFCAFRDLLHDRLQDALTRGKFGGPLPAVKLVTETGIDYEDYNSIVETLNDAVDIAVKEFGASHREICLDATAGFKIFSIATSIVTLNRGLIFSYINNDGRPRYYDAKIDMVSLGEG